MGNEQGSGDGPDLFQVEASDSSIPPVEEIVLPREEAIRQRMRKMILLAIAGLIATVIGWMVIQWMQSVRVRSALADTTDRGTVDDFRDALDLVGGAKPSVRARLLATMALEQGPTTLAEAEKQIAEMNSSSDSDLQLARAYVALAKGDTAAADAELAKPGTYDEQAAEFFRARSLLSITRGQWADALADANTAVQMRSDSPRLTSLQALTMGRTGSLDDALSGLDDVSATPEAAVTAARLLAFVRGDLDAASEKASAALTENDISARQAAWAHVITGLAAYRQGRISNARRHAGEAVETVLAWDELLTLRTAQLQLLLGRTAVAQGLLERLPSGPSSDLPLRAHTLAWWYADHGNPRGGLAILSGAGFDPKRQPTDAMQAFALARTLAQSTREADRKRAASLYPTASKSTAWTVAAAASAGQLALAGGDAAAAIAALEPGLAAHPHHPELVRLLARAHIVAGQPEKADALTKSAADGLGDEAWAHGARGELLISLGRYKDALASLGEASKLDPSDAELHGWRGEAAYRSGNATVAREAFTKALELDADAPRSLTGMLALHNDARNLDEGAKIVKRLGEAGVVNENADLQIGRHLVASGAGLAGAKQLRQALTRHRRHAELRMLMGRLYMQAGEFAKAPSFFERAKRLGADGRRADLAAAVAYGAARRPRATERSLEASKEHEGAASDQLKAWATIAKARIQLAKNRGGYAYALGKKAAERAPADPDVLLFRADVAEDRERPSLEYLKGAANGIPPMPVAAGRAALQVGATPEGCQLASRYLAANRYGKLAPKLRELCRGQVPARKSP